MTKDEALKRALELAQEGVEIHSPNAPEYKVCAALIALAQPEQEPAGHGGRPMTLRECMEAEETEQESVASVHIKDGCLVGSHRDESKPFLDGQYGLWPIKSPPPQRKPLTDEEIKPLIQKAMVYYGYDNIEHWSLTSGAGFYILARAIEAAHGIKENK